MAKDTLVSTEVQSKKQTNSERFDNSFVELYPVYKATNIKENMFETLLCEHFTILNM
jgi:hypothetical protein